MIKQVYYQAQMPTEPFTDPYGTPLKVGAQVAYNYCGGVRLGIITKFECKWKSVRKEESGLQWWHINSKVWINEKSGHSSLLKNLNGIVILN